MTCGDKFNKNCPTEGSKVDPTEVDGRPRCDHPGCDKHLQGDGTCVDGHVQGVAGSSATTIAQLQVTLAAAQVAVAAQGEALRQIYRLETRGGWPEDLAQRVSAIAEAGLAATAIVQAVEPAAALSPEEASWNHPDVQAQWAAFQQVLWGQEQGWQEACDWDSLADDLYHLAQDGYGGCTPSSTLQGNTRMKAVMDALVAVLETRRDVAQAARREIEVPEIIASDAAAGRMAVPLAAAPAAAPAVTDGPRCRNPHCGRRLQPDGQCPRGCRQDEEVFGGMAIGFGGQSRLDEYDWAAADPYHREYVLPPIVPGNADEVVGISASLHAHAGDVDAYFEEALHRAGEELCVLATQRTHDDLTAFRDGLEALRERAATAVTEDMLQDLTGVFQQLTRSPAFSDWQNLGEGDPFDALVEASADLEEWQAQSERAAALSRLQCPSCGGKLHGRERGDAKCDSCGAVYEDEDFTVEVHDLPTFDVQPWIKDADVLRERVTELAEALQGVKAGDRGARQLAQVEMALDQVANAAALADVWHEHVWDKKALLENMQWRVVDGVAEALQEDEVAQELLASGSSRRRRQVPILVLVPPPQGVAAICAAEAAASLRAADWGTTADDARRQGRVDLAYRLYAHTVRQGLREDDPRTVALALTCMGMLSRGSNLKGTKFPRALLECAREQWAENADTAGLGTLTEEAATELELARLATAEQRWSEAHDAYTRAVAFLQNGGHEAEGRVREERAEAAWRMATFLGDSDNTARRAVAECPEAALNYALFVDKGPHRSTWVAAQRDPAVARKYRSRFQSEHPQFFRDNPF